MTATHPTTRAPGPTSPAPPMRPGPAPGKPRPKAGPQDVQLGWLGAYRGQLIGVRLLDGKMLRGKLGPVDTFTFALECDTGVLLVFKQTVSYLVPPSALRDPMPPQP